MPHTSAARSAARSNAHPQSAKKLALTDSQFTILHRFVGVEGLGHGAKLLGTSNENVKTLMQRGGAMMPRAVERIVAKLEAWDEANPDRPDFTGFIQSVRAAASRVMNADHKADLESLAAVAERVAQRCGFST